MWERQSQRRRRGAAQRDCLRPPASGSLATVGGRSPSPRGKTLGVSALRPTFSPLCSACISAHRDEATLCYTGSLLEALTWF